MNLSKCQVFAVKNLTINQNNMLYIAVLPIFLLLFVSIHFDIKRHNRDEKLLNFSRNLFNSKLLPLCENALTLGECSEAWNILHESCVDFDSDSYIIHRVYYNEFEKLKSLLQGKIFILEHIKYQ